MRRRGGRQGDVEELETRDYSKMENPSLLRFLVDMRGEEVRTPSPTFRDPSPLVNAFSMTLLLFSYPSYLISRRRRRGSCATT
jgi:hypothetical protein